MSSSAQESTDQDKKIIPLPGIQLIGVQKAGTSSIADWLFEEGGVRRPVVFDNEPWYYSKEVHFFDSDQRFNQGLEFYAKRFPTLIDGMDGVSNANFTQLSMDATPDTLPFAERVRFTYDMAGGSQAENLKIIVILREPGSRELSLYNHLVFDYQRLSASDRTKWHDQVIKLDGSIMTFDEFVQSTSIPALARDGSGPGRSSRHGLYAFHLRKWFDLFDRQQILVLSYDELTQDPRKLQGRIEAFLQLCIPGKLRHANSNDHPDKLTMPSTAAKKALQNVFHDHNKSLYQLLEANPGAPFEQHPFPRFFED